MNLQANSVWLYIVPRGMRSLMNYIKNNYGNPLVIITENGKHSSKHTKFLTKSKDLIRCYWVITGMDDPNDPFKPIKEALKDEKRIRYHNGYLTNLLAAIK